MTDKSYADMTEAERDAQAETAIAGHLDGSAPLEVLGEREIALVDVRALRARLGLTQDRFARRFGFSTAAVRNWEQSRRWPDRSARILLRMIELEPEKVARIAREA
ncbi:hypothetical protein OCGS_0824 [Oceaniovalibus guishaninsula JLT2003]|uniref:HTH cro/C1-type domain-containing protein n=1 Tax=Oceaniovalibus guishaninsula JLT2003 TaxID=1231392 RepID=K2HQU5_9RHOB|nr:helix-turn-helix domain-containing protein [Oceaniovalibus guishaninsula]EKE45129.1 hypothetical protein OCGS_0824 [Oceaniovalibus guishaninsula JLT2003]